MLQNQEKNVCYKGNDGLLCYNTNNRKYVIKEMTISYVTKPRKELCYKGNDDFLCYNTKNRKYVIKEMTISYATKPRKERMLFRK